MEIPSPAALMERIHALDGFAELAPRLPPAPPLYLVGGAVRDLLLGRRPRELDLVVEGDAVELARTLSGAATEHPQFGTATVELGGGPIDLVTARRERYARPGALPEVEPADLRSDLARRDFTVNAMAVALNGARSGALSGVPHAHEDLHASRLRVLHEASFRDDPTRLLRLVRYAARLGFSAEPRTAAFAERARDAGALDTVSGPRIAAELRWLAREADPVGAFAALRAAGLDRAIAPGFGIVEDTVARSALAVLGEHGSVPGFVLGLAFAALAAGERAALVSRLGLSAAERSLVEALAGADRLATRLAAAESPSEIAAAADGVRLEAVALAGARGADRAARRWIEELRLLRSEITGEDLLRAGVPAGPAIGRGLRAARAARLDGRAPSRDAELAEALRAARRPR